MIKVKGLCAGYGRIEVLKSLHLELNQGRQTALLGPNGAGKSTLLNCLSGYLQPFAGQIEIAGKDIREYSRREMAQQVALIPQNFHLQFDYQVKDLVLMGRYPYLGYLGNYSSNDHAKVMEVLSDLDLVEMAGKNFGELSGGEQQRVAIARALVQETPILLMDEAFANLDVNHAISIMQLLSKINSSQGKTIVLVSHNINLAVEYCDEVVIMKAGRIVKKGRGEEVISEEVLARVYEQKIRVITNPVSNKPNLVYSL